MVILHRAFAWINLLVVDVRFADFYVQHGRVEYELIIHEALLYNEEPKNILSSLPNNNK